MPAHAAAILPSTCCTPVCAGVELQTPHRSYTASAVGTTSGHSGTSKTHDSTSPHASEGTQRSAGARNRRGGARGSGGSGGLGGSADSSSSSGGGGAHAERERRTQRLRMNILYHIFKAGSLEALEGQIIRHAKNFDHDHVAVSMVTLVKLVGADDDGEDASMGESRAGPARLQQLEQAQRLLTGLCTALLRWGQGCLLRGGLSAMVW